MLSSVVVEGEEGVGGGVPFACQQEGSFKYKRKYLTSGLGRSLKGTLSVLIFADQHTLKLRNSAKFTGELWFILKKY